MQRTIAIITDRRAQPNQNGTHVCAVTCPACGFTRGLTYGGWSAIVCGGCKSTLYRTRRSMGADNASA